ncbi:hypothetical protein IQ07DRAFT_629354 [Pyrenochaeta sp. DS3sAY3a]|nr:hypothetical protein IQ07DRAFT_629354 [Pyrenochaeta sp. DS3sAY3a]
MDEGARKLGERVLGEVREEGLSEVLDALRELEVRKRLSSSTTPTPPGYFSIPALDSLLPSPLSPPILELISPPPTHHSHSGKTSLLYLITTLAILPPSFRSAPLSGKNTSIILFDPLHRFSVHRLAQIVLNYVVDQLRAHGQRIDEDEDDDATKTEIKSLVRNCLLHVHIFRPQSWGALLASLDALPAYLFDATRHSSMQRRVHALLLDDIDAFVPVLRNERAGDSNSSGPANPLTAASVRLTSVLQRLAREFFCGIVLTGHSSSAASFRPSLPVAWAPRAGEAGRAAGDAARDTTTQSTTHQSVTPTRLAVRRIQVLKFAPAISLEEAEAERQQRWDVVSKGRFECWRIGVGIAAGEGEGFVFRVGKGGVWVEEGEEKGGG